MMAGVQVARKTLIEASSSTPGEESLCMLIDAKYATSDRLSNIFTLHHFHQAMVIDELHITSLKAIQRGFEVYRIYQSSTTGLT